MFFIYFNDQLISLQDTVKIPVREAGAGVVIDASSTFMSDGYRIEKAEWDFGNGEKSVIQGPPVVEYQTYEEGRYDLTLKLTRNDDKVLTKNIRLVVGDPIADIYATKSTLRRGETVTFKANKISTENTSYFWEVRLVGTNQPLYVDQGPTMTYSFHQIGRYQIVLTSEKIDGSRDQDTEQIIVESQPPIAHYEYRKVNDELPNTILFDASRSYDPDLEDESTLRYTWFIDGLPIQLENQERNGSRGTYTFDERGTYSVTLAINDSEGKTTSITQDVEILSTLHIRLDTVPLVARIGQRVLFNVATSPEVETYAWDFGDKSVDTTTVGRSTHTYTLAGRYDVRVTVADQFGDKNTLKKTIHVVDADTPFAILDINSGSIFSEEAATGCNGQPAILTDRVSGVFLSGERSVNSS